jgi:hypothetical protein
LILGILSSILLGSTASLQDTLRSSNVPLRDLGDALTVTLVTYEQGGRLFERYGHNAIWIHDATTGTDEHYDYGRFSFNQQNFLLRFIRGQMWYSMGFESDVRGVVDAYVGQGRKVWMQELDLSPEAKLQLREFLAWNYRPESRDYAYDYYRDNCSTRIRDALDRVIGGAIRRYGDSASGWTWRDETRRLNQHSTALYTGLLVVLGQPVDREMSRWEQMFLPMRLRETMNFVRIPGPDGVLRPVVRSERLVSPGGQWPAPDRPSNWLPYYVVAGLVLGALMYLVGQTRAFLPVATLWMLLVGLLGAFMLVEWVTSYHQVAYSNENLLQFNLAALALAIVLPAGLRGRAWARRPARFLGGAVAGLSLLGLILKPVPWFFQHNLEVIAMILPVHLAVWLGVRRRIGGSGQ